jgi:hypothetical protein
MTNILEATSFGATSTTDDVLSSVNLKEKRILVTGVSAGIGWKRRGPWPRTALRL